MNVVLDPVLKALMSQDEWVSVLWQDENEHSALLIKAPGDTILGFRGSILIQWQFSLGRTTVGSVIRLVVTVFDNPKRPCKFESFINVGSDEQLACVSQLAKQDEMVLHFFDGQTEYVFTKKVLLPKEQRSELHQLIAQAIQDHEQLSDQYDFNAAKALVMKNFPL